MALKDLLKIDFQLVGKGNGKKVFDGLFGNPADVDPVEKICALIASATLWADELGGPKTIHANVLAALYQDDDAHEDCSLTACLNPLHPGPCKGWKGTLHSVSPGAWHALEAARVEKANTARVKKIEALKAQGKPIPHKLLQPIVAKPHPNAGKTANAATGEAHAAGQAVSDAAGVHVKEPGKVTLGQAIKPIPQNTGEKGPKGKKPTVASKGIAFVIAQDKVTPQYKLDKAAAITSEQWSGLSEADKSSIRGELAKISIDGFGKQQEKANELLAKLPAHPQPSAVDKAQAANAAHHKQAAEAAKAAAEAAPTKLASDEAVGKLADALSKPKTLGEVAVPTSPLHTPKTPGEPLSAKNYTAMTPTNVAKLIAKDGSADVMVGGKKVTVGFEGGGHGGTLTMAPGGLYVVTTKDGEKIQLGKGELVQVVPKAPASAAVKTPAVPAADKPKPLPKHVQNAIAMSKGEVPGASWSKNHLAAYQPLSAEEFHALPKDTQATIVSELTKGQSKFLDPKKIAASKALLEKFGHGEGPKVAAPKLQEVDFATHLHDHNVTPTQAKEAADKAPIGAHFLAAKQTAGLTDLDNPDSPHHQAEALEKADQLVELQTGHYGDAEKLLEQPAVKAAVEHLGKTAYELKYAQSVKAAKERAFNKISVASGKGQGLAPIEKASLVHYGKYLLKHDSPSSSTAIDKLQKDTVDAVNDLNDKLQAAQKKANAPKAEDMSSAQIADRAKELLGDTAASPDVHLSVGETKQLASAGEHEADVVVAKYAPGVKADPTVDTKHSQMAIAAGQLLATKAKKGKLADHLYVHHEAVLQGGVDISGNPLTADDKKVIEKHAKVIKATYGYLDSIQANQEKKLAEATSQLDAAAKDAESLLKPQVPGGLDQFDQDTIGEVYRGAWGKAASKAVLYGIKTYGTKTQMNQHPEFEQFKQDLGNLQQLAGKLAVAHAVAKTAQQNVPSDPDTGALDKSTPEYKALGDALDARSAADLTFSQLHKVAQGRLDTIRASVGLKKRALPKVDAPAVKTAAAESAYYKTGGYGKPLYGKPASAKQYLVAKVGPALAVPHKTSSDKAAEKSVKQATPPPKVHVKPPSSEAGKKPNAETAAALGYHYSPVVAHEQHGWAPGASPAYVSSPEDEKALVKHLEDPDTKFGLPAQKEFKWSIDNMEGKGAAASGKNALFSYTGSSYGSINTKLNELPPGAKSPGGQISSIDAAFKASPPLEGDVVLYRGFSSPETVFKSGKWNDVNVAGVEWSQRSYSSTSGALSTAQSFAGYSGVVMRVIIPKEMKVKGINAKGGQHPGENEIILQRGIRYRVVADYGKNVPGDSRRYIDVMVVPNPYDKS